MAVAGDTVVVNFSQVEEGDNSCWRQVVVLFNPLNDVALRQPASPQATDNQSIPAATGLKGPAVAAEKAVKTSNIKTRVEEDLLGKLEVPEDAYYGVHTMRALDNFQISYVTVNSIPRS